MKKLNDLLTLDEVEIWVLEKIADQNVTDVGIPCDCYSCPLANYLEDQGFIATVHAEEIHIFPEQKTNALYDPIAEKIQFTTADQYTAIAMPSELTYFIGFCDKHHTYMTRHG